MQTTVGNGRLIQHPHGQEEKGGAGAAEAEHTSSITMRIGSPRDFVDLLMKCAISFDDYPEQYDPNLEEFWYCPADGPWYVNGHNWIG